MTISHLDGEIFARLLEICNDAIFVTDAEGRYLAANQAALDLVGYDLEELTTLSMHDLLPSEDRLRLRHRVAGLREDRTRLVERELLHRDGHRVPVEIGATALPDGRMVGIVRNIAPRRAAETRAVRLWNILNTLLSVAEHLARPQGMNPEEICGLLSQGQAYALAWIGVARRESGEVEVIAAAGEAAPYTRTIAVRFDDSPEGRGPTGRCIREGRRIVNNRLRQNPAFAPWRETARDFGLEASASFPLLRGGVVWGALNIYAQTVDAFDAAEVTLIERMAAHLGGALDAEDAARDRQTLERQFFAADRLVSLGTFAASVAEGFGEALRVSMEKVDRLSRGEALEQVLPGWEQSLEQARHLQDHVDELSRAAEPRLEALSVAEVASGVVSVARARLDPRVRVIDELPPALWVMADRVRLGQILLNLLANAGDALSSFEGPGEIRIGAHENDGTAVTIWVEDTGPGVPECDRERIFEPFFGARADDAGGAGVSLAVSRQLAEAMGGGLRLSEAVGGARFELTLPRAQPAGPELQLPPVAKAGVKPGRRILVVDDEVMLADALGGLLGLRHQVQVCYDAATALDRCAQERFDLVLCDLHMPKMNGVAFYQALRARTDAHAERMAFMSGGFFNQEIEAFLSTVQNPKLAKPIGLDAVEALFDL